MLNKRIGVLAVMLCLVATPAFAEQPLQEVTQEHVSVPVPRHIAWDVEVYKKTDSGESVLCKEQLDRISSQQEQRFLYSGNYFSVMESLKDNIIVLQIKNIPVSDTNLSETCMFAINGNSYEQPLREIGLYIRVKSVLPRHSVDKKAARHGGLVLH